MSQPCLKKLANVKAGIDLPYGDAAEEVLAKLQVPGETEVAEPAVAEPADSSQPEENVTKRRPHRQPFKSYLSEEYDGVLHTMLCGMGMEQYLPLFQQAGIVTTDLLIRLTDDDLSAIGVESFAHRKIIAETLSTIRRNVLRNSNIESLQADVEDVVLYTDDVLPMVCHNFKYINSLVIATGQIRRKFEAKQFQNRPVDPEHTAAEAAALLTAESIVQAQLIKSELEEMMVKFEKVHPRSPSSKKAAAEKKKRRSQSKHKVMLGIFFASVITLAATVRHYLKS